MCTSNPDIVCFPFMPALYFTFKFEEFSVLRITRSLATIAHNAEILAQKTNSIKLICKHMEKGDKENVGDKSIMCTEAMQVGS